MDYLRDQKKLHKKYVLMLLLKILDILKALPPLVDEEIPMYLFYYYQINNIFFNLATRKSLFAAIPMANITISLTSSSLTGSPQRRTLISSTETSLIEVPSQWR